MKDLIRTNNPALISYVEALLKQHTGVREVLVIDRELKRERQLVAYVIAQTETPPTAAELRDHVRANLPEQLPRFTDRTIVVGDVVHLRGGVLRDGWEGWLSRTAVCGADYEVPAALQEQVTRVAPDAASRSRRGTPSLDLRAGRSKRQPAARLLDAAL